MSSTDRSRFRPDIEGLRGIAVLIVVAFHCGIGALAGGFVGVDVFFVLSGYLITGLLVAEVERTSRLNLLQFYARRARRLLPAAVPGTSRGAVTRTRRYPAPPASRPGKSAKARLGSG